MYWDHMDGWWAWMVVWPWIGILAVAVYVAVRLGVRDGMRDQS